MKQDIEENIDFVQRRINDIKKIGKLEIKQISDLQRYTEMQMNQIETLRVVFRLIERNKFN